VFPRCYSFLLLFPISNVIKESTAGNRRGRFVRYRSRKRGESGLAWRRAMSVHRPRYVRAVKKHHSCNAGISEHPRIFSSRAEK